MQSSIGDGDFQSVEPAQQPRVLVFHKISTAFSYGISNYSPNRFFRLLDGLIRGGIALGSLEDNCVRPDPGQISVTFDDGYAHLYDLLIETKEKYKFEPLLFVPTGWIGRSNKWDYCHFLRREQHLGMSQLKSLHQAGINIGSHGHSHRNLCRMPYKELERELVESRKVLEDALGAEVDFLSYPFGAVDQRVARFAETAGYRYGFSMNHHRELGPFGIGRSPVYCFDSAASIRRKLAGSRLGRSQTKLISTLSTGTDLLNRFRRS